MLSIALLKTSPLSPASNKKTKANIHVKGIYSHFKIHYSDVIIGAMASQMTIVYSTVYPGAVKKKTSKLRVIGLCAGNSPVTGEFPAQMASNAENVSI